MKILEYLCQSVCLHYLLVWLFVKRDEEEETCLGADLPQRRSLEKGFLRYYGAQHCSSEPLWSSPSLTADILSPDEVSLELGQDPSLLVHFSSHCKYWTCLCSCPFLMYLLVRSLCGNGSALVGELSTYFQQAK